MGINRKCTFGQMEWEFIIQKKIEKNIFLNFHKMQVRHLASADRRLRLSVTRNDFDSANVGSRHRITEVDLLHDERPDVVAVAIRTQFVAFECNLQNEGECALLTIWRDFLGK